MPSLIDAAQKVLSAAAARTLVEAAMLAPSGDNLQPWQFDVHLGEGRIRASVDPTRDTSPMNAGQRMSRVAVGAAVENILRTAAFNRIEATIESVTADTVTICLGSSAREDLAIEPVLGRRCTNRKRYEIRPDLPVPNPSESSLQEADGVRAHWITDRARIERIASIVRQADTILFSHHAMRRAFFENVRFDLRNGEPANEGLPLSALEIHGAEERAFRLLPKLPDWMAHVLQIGRSIGRQSEKLVQSASGICVGTAADDDASTDFAVGRVMQRTWLSLTERGLAAQPMMSLPVLLNAIDHRVAGIAEAGTRGRIESLATQLKECLGDEERRPAFLLRAGFSDGPTGRAGRRDPG